MWMIKAAIGGLVGGMMMGMFSMIVAVIAGYGFWAPMRGIPGMFFGKDPIIVPALQNQSSITYAVTHADGTAEALRIGPHPRADGWGRNQHGHWERRGGGRHFGDDRDHGRDRDHESDDDEDSDADRALDPRADSGQAVTHAGLPKIPNGRTASTTASSTKVNVIAYGV